jgi:hypothetical protein
LVELLFGDSRELDAKADSHYEPTFIESKTPSHLVSHSSLTWASVGP